MKKILYIIIPLMLLSCEKIFVNGELDGMWKLEIIEEDGNAVYPGNIYYSFQRHLVMLGEYYPEGVPSYYMAEFDKVGNVLTMTKFYKYPGRDGICNMEELEKYYIFSEKVDFVVETLNEDVLVMRNGDVVYKFRKW